MAFAVSNHYWYQLFVDELPVWGMVGEILADEDVINEIEAHVERPHGIAEATFLYTHKNFTIAYHDDRVIEVNMTSEGAVPIAAGATFDLTYSVHWVEVETPFEQRFNRYLENNFFEHQIHWFSLFNSVSAGGGGGCDFVVCGVASGRCCVSSTLSPLPPPSHPTVHDDRLPLRVGGAHPDAHAQSGLRAVHAGRGGRLGRGGGVPGGGGVLRV